MGSAKDEQHGFRGIYRSACNGQIHFPSGGTHERSEFVADALQYTQPIVVGERLEEVLDGITFVLSSHMSLQFLNNL